MLDRAGAGFEAVTDTRHVVEAMPCLVRIYEAGPDWPQAIEAVKRLGRLTQEAVPQRVHYHCEQAEAALTAREPQFEEAQKALDGAEQAARELAGECTLGAKVRIALLKALWAQKINQIEQQRDELEPILNFAPMYAGLVAAPLMRCYQELDQVDEGIEVLRIHFDQYPNLMVFNVLFKALREHKGPLEAWHFARKALRGTPSLLALDRMLEVELSAEKDKGVSTTVRNMMDDALTKEVAEGAD